MQNIQLPAEVAGTNNDQSSHTANSQSFNDSTNNQNSNAFKKRQRKQEKTRKLPSSVQLAPQDGSDELSILRQELANTQGQLQ